jgi:hypothetical protein
MRDRAEELMRQLATQAESGRIAIALSEELYRNPPSGERMAALVRNLVPRVPMKSRFGLAVTALELTLRGYGAHEAVDIAVDGAEFGATFWPTLCQLGQRLNGDDALWWHELFCRAVRQDAHYDTLLAAHEQLLLKERRTEVLDYLLVPDRGPGQANIYSFTQVIVALNGCLPLERRLVDWIHEGRFEWRQPGDEHAQYLTLCLAHGLRTRPHAFGPLVTEALARWRYLLTNADPAEVDRGLDVIRQAVEAGVTFDGQLMTAVVDRLDPDQVPLVDGMRSAVVAAGALEAEINEPRQRDGFTKPAIRQFSEAGRDAPVPVDPSLISSLSPFQRDSAGLDQHRHVWVPETSRTTADLPLRS